MHEPASPAKTPGRTWEQEDGQAKNGGKKTGKKRPAAA